MEQRWLSINGICEVLGLPKNRIKWLVSMGFLTVMQSGKGKNLENARYLDPTPEYAAKLKLGEDLYYRLHPLPSDLELKNLFSIAELAEIMGWSLSYARNYTNPLHNKHRHRHRYENAFSEELNKNKVDIPFTRIGKVKFFSIDTVRRLLWSRHGRKLSKQKSPFLIQELLEFFWKQNALAQQEVPTDAEFKDDELLERKLRRMAKMRKGPEKTAAYKDFFYKTQLAKSTVWQIKRALRATDQTNGSSSPSEPQEPGLSSADGPSSSRVSSRSLQNLSRGGPREKPAP